MSLFLNMKKLEKSFTVLSHTFQTKYLPKKSKESRAKQNPLIIGIFFLFELNGRGITIKVLDYYSLQYCNFSKAYNIRFHQIALILSFICWKFIQGSEA